MKPWDVNNIMAERNQTYSHIIFGDGITEVGYKHRGSCGKTPLSARASSTGVGGSSGRRNLAVNVARSVERLVRVVFLQGRWGTTTLDYYG